MIRINLLPVKQRKKAEAGRRQLIVFAIAALVQVGVMVLLYEMVSGEVEERQAKVNLLKNDIDRLKKQVGDYDALTSQREQLKQQREAIRALQSGRTGPIDMLRELSSILSVGGGPTIDEKEYQRLIKIGRKPINQNWNPRRVWITKVDEKNRAVKLTGLAKDHDDVAELLRRLTLSTYFANVELARNDLVADASVGSKLVRWSLTCNVMY